MLVDLFVFSTNDYAQEQSQDQNPGQDKTGTNPINFQRDLRVYNEFSRLNTEGDGSMWQINVQPVLPFQINENCGPLLGGIAR